MMYLLLFAFIPFSAGEEPAKMPTFAPTGDKVCVNLVFEHGNNAAAGKTYGLSGTYFMNSLDPNNIPEEYRENFKKFPIEPAMVNGRYAFTKRGSDRTLTFADGVWKSQEGDDEYPNIQYEVGMTGHTGWQNKPDWSGINDDDGLFPYEGKTMWWMHLYHYNEEIVFVDAQLKDNFEDCMTWSISPTMNPTTVTPTKTPTWSSDEYVRTLGSCETGDGRRPTSYTWKYDQFVGDEVPGPSDGLCDTECREVCDNSDLCVGYETRAEESCNLKTDCVIMIERTEFSGDGNAESDRTCYQKKEYDDKSPDFEKVGAGKCTVGGQVPKVLKLWAEKQECKKQCNEIDNCYGFNINTSDQYCYLWVEGPIDGSDETSEGDFGSCKMKNLITVRNYHPSHPSVAAIIASSHHIIVGGVGIGLMSAAVVLAWNCKKAGHREELETLI